MDKEKEEYFYTTQDLHAWTSGPTHHTLVETDGVWDKIHSLEQARELAIAARVRTDRMYVVTTYGVQYSTKDPES